MKILYIQDIWLYLHWGKCDTNMILYLFINLFIHFAPCDSLNMTNPIF